MLQVIGDLTPVPLFMADSTDHNTGKTGLTLTVTRRKEGGAFGAAGGSVAEIANGWYEWTPASGDVDALGFLLVHATGAGADPADARVQVVAFNPYDAAALGLSRIDSAVSAAKTLTSAYDAAKTAAPTGEAAAALASYDPPTRAEATVDKDAVIAALPAAPNNAGIAAAAAAAASADARAADLQARVPAALVGGKMDASAEIADKDGFRLASDGLALISAPEPTAKPTTFVGWIMWGIQRLRHSTMTATELKVLTEDGDTVTTQATSDDGTTQTVGPPV